MVDCLLTILLTLSLFWAEWAEVSEKLRLVGSILIVKCFLLFTFFRCQLFKVARPPEAKYHQKLLINAKRVAFIFKMSGIQAYKLEAIAFTIKMHTLPLSELTFAVWGCSQMALFGHKPNWCQKKEG